MPAQKPATGQAMNRRSKSQMIEKIMFLPIVMYIVFREWGLAIMVPYWSCKSDRIENTFLK